ncbi:MAG: hypothetical protein SFV54_26065 [Bryobacteraceae bacterium]|nr:hypothetical protein [Bryobacteraceae bacterium]
MLSRLLIVTACAASFAAAQEKDVFQIRVPAPGEGANQRVAVFTPAAAADVVHFVGAGEHFESETVKGAPYSAEAVSETSQRLADGNRITRKDVSKIWRDSEGRTRRERSLTGVGPWSTSEAPKEIVWINDPVAKTMLHLDPAGKVARRIPGMGATFTIADHVPGTAAVRVEHLPMRVQLESGVAPKKEDLGKKMVEGVMASGSRTTLTIPAGAIGNDQPIDVVTERWFSDELKAVVYSKHTDPRVGDTVYRLTNLNRSEPARYLFEIPADYKVEEAPGIGHGTIRMQRHKEAR